ncbi:MAG: F-box protein [Candidatus Andersenbacteria bacterium]
MENQKGFYNEWELDFICHINPSILRKRLREEFEYLYSVGTLVDAIRNDDLLCHILSYAWKSIYTLALVCKRFYTITKMRRYWTALAKHALKDRIPPKVLEAVNFFYFAKDDDPAHLFLQALVVKNNLWDIKCMLEEEKAIYLYFPIGDGKKVGRLCIAWRNEFKDNLCHYSMGYGLYGPGVKTREIDGELRTHISFNHPVRRKLVWINVKQTDGSRVSKYQYCEVYCPERNQIWYGQPGTIETSTDEFPTPEELYPGPNSLGVWK